MSKEAALAALTGTVPAPPPPTPEGSPGLTTQEQTPDLQKELDSSRFAQLAKKEAEVVRQREETKREREQLQKEKEAYQEFLSKINRFEELKKTDRIAAIKELGFSDTDILNAFAAAEESQNDPVLNAQKAAQQTIEEFKKEQAAKEAEATKKQNDSVISRFKSEITQVVTADKEKFEYCNHYGPVAEDLIFATVKAVLDDSGEIISSKEAAELVEGYYEEQDKAMSTLKKRTPAEAAQHAKEEVVKAAEDEKTEAGKTLNSKATATVAATIARKETAEQKRARLVERLRTGT